MPSFASSSVARAVRSWGRRHTTLSLGLASLGVAVLTAACLSTAGGGGGTDDCEKGSEGCACFGNKTCLDDLSCRSNLCVDTSEDGDDGDGGSKPSKPSASDDETDDDGPAADDTSDEPSPDDVDSDEPATDDSETDEVATDESTDDDSATDDPPTDDPETDDTATDDAVTDETVSDDPVTDEVATDDTATDETSTDDLATDDTVTDDTVTDDTVTDETVTDETSTDDSDPPECTEGSGTCAAGDGIDCVDGQYAERDCTACALLTCGVACCDSVWPLVAESDPYLRRDDLLDAFEVTAEQATVSAAFTGYDEFAAVGFTFATPQAIDLLYLQFDAVVTGTVIRRVSLELDDTTGCVYSTSSAGYLTSELGCWGAWEDTGYGGSARSVLIRIHSEVSQLASISVSSVSWETL